MKTTVRTEGFQELDKALAELPKATAKNVMRRVLRKVAQPMADTMKAKAPDDPKTGGNDLRSSIGVGTQLSKRQRGLHRKMFKDDKASVEVFVGAGPVPQAHLQEFGTVHHGPQPFARPAWDQHREELIPQIGNEMWAEIEKAAQRLARKAARAAAKGK